jgi:hypothetical protein
MDTWDDDQRQDTPRTDLAVAEDQPAVEQIAETALADDHPSTWKC